MSVLERFRNWLKTNKQPSGTTPTAVEHLADGTLLIQATSNLRLKLHEKEGFGGGTRISHFGYLASTSIDPSKIGSGAGPFGAVVVLSDPPANWSRYLRARCAIAFMAKIYNQAGIGNELAIRLQFEDFDDAMILVFNASGGSFDPERQWVNNLRAANDLVILPDIHSYDRLFAVGIENNPVLAEEVMKSLI